jgi:hypothetical protein
MSLMHGDQEKNKYYASLVSEMERIATVWPKESWKIYDYPVTYIGKYRVDIPRSELPPSGIFKMWFPLPITLGYQQPVEVLSIEPAGYVVLPPSNSGDISTLYMEVPLEKLEGSLRVEVRFRFTHYEQHFRVDPALVGPYDTSDPEYLAYTRSSGNVAVTPEIKATAEHIVGAEKNPYIAAKKIYDYMIKTIDYSYMPHLLLLSALRAQGVGLCPRIQDRRLWSTRVLLCGPLPGCRHSSPRSGGWQLFSGNFSPHFGQNSTCPITVGFPWTQRRSSITLHHHGRS